MTTAPTPWKVQHGWHMWPYLPTLAPAPRENCQNPITSSREIQRGGIQHAWRFSGGNRNNKPAENGAGKAKNTDVAAILPPALQKSLSYFIKHHHLVGGIIARSNILVANQLLPFVTCWSKTIQVTTQVWRREEVFATVELVGGKNKFSSCLRTAAHFKGWEFVQVSLHCSPSLGRKEFQQLRATLVGLCLCLPLLPSPGSRYSSSTIFCRWKQMK